MKRLKRIFVLLLAAAMVLSMIPASAFAADPATEPETPVTSVAEPSKYFVQNEGWHYWDADPLTQEYDLGTATLYLEKNDAELVVPAKVLPQMVHCRSFWLNLRQHQKLLQN